MGLLRYLITTLVGFWLVCLSQPAHGESHVDKLIKSFLEDLRNILKNGSPTYKIPVLDPSYIGAHMNADNKEISVSAWLEGSLSGISDYTVNKVHMDLDLNVQLNLTFPALKFQGLYNLTGSALSGLVPLTGHGPLYIFLQEVTVALTPNLVAEGGYLKMNKCNFTFSEQDVELSLGGLLGDGIGGVLQPALNDLASSLLERYRTKLEALVDMAIVDLFNLFGGKGVTLYTIIDAIKSFLS